MWHRYPVSVTAMRERDVERHLVEGVKALGGVALKLAPTPVGLPDRRVLLPGGRVVFVEVKTVLGRVSSIQEFQHKRLRALGFEVLVVFGAAGVEMFLEGLA